MYALTKGLDPKRGHRFGNFVGAECTTHDWLRRGFDQSDESTLISGVIHVDSSVYFSEISAETIVSGSTVRRQLKKDDFESRRRPSTVHLSERHKIQETVPTGQ